MRAKLYLAYLIVVLALALCACAGAQSTPAPEAGGPDLLTALPPLGAYDVPDRNVSVDVLLTKQGFEPVAMSAGAVVNGTGLDLVTGPSVLEWALYRFALTDKVPRKYATDVTVNGGQYWLAVANYKTGLWEFYGPYDASVPELPTVPFPDYKSPGKNAFLAVIAASISDVDTDMTINSITLTAASGTSGEL